MQTQFAPQRERAAPRRQGTRDDVWYSERGTPTPISIDHRSRQSIDIDERRPNPFSPRHQKFDLGEYERRNAADLRHKALFLRPQPARKESNRAKSAGDEARDSRDILQNEFIGSPGSYGVNRNRERNSSPNERPRLPRVQTLDESMDKLDTSDPQDDSPASDHSGRRSADEPQFCYYVKRSNTEESAILDSDDTDYEDDKSTADILTGCSEQLGRARDLVMSKSSSSGDQALQLGRTLDEQLFHLKIWARESNLLAVASTGQDTNESINLARSVLARLESRAKKLCKSLGDVNLKHKVPLVQEGDLDTDVAQDRMTSLPDPTTLETLQAEQEIKGIKLQLRTLRRLTRTVRETQEDEKTRAVKAHIEEIGKYFGTEAACKTNGVAEGMPPDSALAMAREKALSVNGAVHVCF